MPQSSGIGNPAGDCFYGKGDRPGFLVYINLHVRNAARRPAFHHPRLRPHCAGVLEGLGEPVKQMLIGKMTVVNVAAHPELAAEYGVRSDACHLLGLAGCAAARAPVEICLDDAHPEVREIAGEAMAALAAQDAKR